MIQSRARYIEEKNSTCEGIVSPGATQERLQAREEFAEVSAELFGEAPRFAKTKKAAQDTENLSGSDSLVLNNRQQVFNKTVG